MHRLVFFIVWSMVCQPIFFLVFYSSSYLRIPPPFSSDMNDNVHISVIKNAYANQLLLYFDQLFIENIETFGFCLPQSRLFLQNQNCLFLQTVRLFPVYSFRALHLAVSGRRWLVLWPPTLEAFAAS